MLKNAPKISQNGYVDQTQLSPQRNDARGTPFSTLLEQLSNMEIERIILLQKRKENHPDVIIVNEQIAQIKAKLNEYNQNTLTSYNIIVKTLHKKSSNLRYLIKQYTDKIEKLPDQESQLIRLLVLYSKSDNQILQITIELYDFLIPLNY